MDVKFSEHGFLVSDVLVFSLYCSRLRARLRLVLSMLKSLILCPVPFRCRLSYARSDSFLNSALNSLYLRCLNTGAPENH